MPDSNTTTLPWPIDSLLPLDLKARLKYLEFDTIVDWGCGPNNGLISGQVKELKCKMLISVDAYPEYLSRLANDNFEASIHRLVTAQVEGYAEEMVLNDDTVDLSLCLDIVEHIEMNEAIIFLGNIVKVSKHVLVWIPLGVAPIGHDTFGGENHYWHTHRSTWSKEDLEHLGFAVEVFDNFHTGMFDHRVDAAWAYRKGEA